MPATAVSQFYTFAALTIVSSILICTFNSYTITLRSTIELEQLKNMLSSVAAHGNELLAFVTSANSTLETVIQPPSRIGNKQYWMRLTNDTSHAWLEGSLGQICDNAVMHKVFLPGKISVSGHYVSGYGAIIMECYMNGTTEQLNMRSSSQD